MEHDPTGTSTIRDDEPAGRRGHAHHLDRRTGLSDNAWVRRARPRSSTWDDGRSVGGTTTMNATTIPPMHVGARPVPAAAGLRS